MLFGEERIYMVCVTSYCPCCGTVVPDYHGIIFTSVHSKALDQCVYQSHVTPFSDVWSFALMVSPCFL